MASAPARPTRGGRRVGRRAPDLVLAPGLQPLPAGVGHPDQHRGLDQEQSHRPRRARDSGQRGAEGAEEPGRGLSRLAPHLPDILHLGAHRPGGAGQRRLRRPLGLAQQRRQTLPRRLDRLRDPLRGVVRGALRPRAGEAGQQGRRSEGLAGVALRAVERPLRRAPRARDHRLHPLRDVSGDVLQPVVHVLGHPGEAVGDVLRPLLHPVGQRLLAPRGAAGRRCHPNRSCSCTFLRPYCCTIRASGALPAAADPSLEPQAPETPWRVTRRPKGAGLRLWPASVVPRPARRVR